VRHVPSLGLVTACAAVVATTLLLAWPLSEPGVTGSALTPQYREFGWSSYSPLAEHPTLGDLRKARVPVPKDAVMRRRVEAGATAALAIAGFTSWWAIGGRRRA
jgi:hypothetical protein